VGACLAYLAILDLTVLAAYAIGQTVVPDAARGTFGLLGLGVAEAAALVAVLLFWRRVDRRRLAALGLEWQAQPWRRWLRGALIAGLMMGFIVLVGYTLVDGAGWDFNSDALRAGLALIGGLLGFAVQGPAEEVLFRGYILQNVREQWGVGAALVVSSLAFSLLHLSNPAYGVVPFINLVLFGLGTALYRLYVDADSCGASLRSTACGTGCSRSSSACRTAASPRLPTTRCFGSRPMLRCRACCRVAASVPKGRSLRRWCCWH
jgi:membrane protease YdiL (CAAX protease family)